MSATRIPTATPEPERGIQEVPTKGSPDGTPLRSASPPGLRRAGFFLPFLLVLLVAACDSSSSTGPDALLSDSESPSDTVPSDSEGPSDTDPSDSESPPDTVPSDSGEEPSPPSREALWIGSSELAALPTSGPAWESLKAEADGSCGLVDLSDQEAGANVCVLAKALVYARTGEAGYRTDVVAALASIAEMGTYTGRALALGRELAAYVIAADLVDLEGFDPVLDGAFRAKLDELRTTYTSGAAASLVDCHEKRPNNWGAHCGASRAAVAVYLGDDDDLARTARVFKGYLGDRASYAGFEYGSDLSWQCDPERPVGINPAGCARDGLSLDGVLPDDQRRGGSFTPSPPKENYVWEALQGLLAQAVILHRAGYPAFEWEDRALLRAVGWLHQVADYPAEGDDTWQPHLVNHFYAASFPAPLPSRPGKNVGWTDWTHLPAP